MLMATMESSFKASRSSDLPIEHRTTPALPCRSDYAGYREAERR